MHILVVMETVWIVGIEEERIQESSRDGAQSAHRVIQMNAIGTPFTCKIVVSLSRGKSIVVRKLVFMIRNHNVTLALNMLGV